MTSGRLHQVRRVVTVTVINKSVALTKHRVTGLEIKQAAIAQGCRSVG
jgi:hypothetical protein